jgi:hypothetical protein
MKRGKFIAMTTLAGLGSLNGKQVPVGNEGELQDWARRYGVRFADSAGAFQLKGHIAANDLGVGLQALAEVSETPMRAEGSRLRGSYEGRVFEVTLN